MVVNRSVINVMIAAGVLSAGGGVVAAPAIADQSGAVSGSGHSREGTQDGTKPGDTKPGDTKPDDTVHPRSPRWDRSKRPPRPVVWPCERTWTCPWQLSNYRRNNFIGFPIPTLPPPALPVVPVETAVEPDLAVRTGAEAPVPVAPEPVGQPGTWQVQAVAVPAAPVLVRPPAAPPPPASPPAASPPPAANPAAVPVPPPDRVPEPDTAQSLRLGYPEELRYADLRTVAAVALPGLAALAGMTALGGMFGYRQAKAGYVLRTAGAGRFLQ